jgi:hypothetical protein
MNCIKPRYAERILVGFLLLLAFASLTVAQDDTDPNSPTPILLSETGSTRALAVENSGSRRAVSLAKIQSRAFEAGARVNLYATGLELNGDEAANALRVYAEDKAGKTYRFPVLDVQPLKGQDWIYAVTIQLSDEIGFWDAPTADGDVLLRLTWRGLASNEVRLGRLTEITRRVR